MRIVFEASIAPRTLMAASKYLAVFAAIGFLVPLAYAADPNSVPTLPQMLPPQVSSPPLLPSPSNAMPAAPSVPTVTTASAPAELKLPGPEPSPALQVSVPQSPDPTMTMNTQSSGGPVSGKSLNALENKVSDSVKDVIKNFSSSSENVTLDDLNSAKIALAKVDALIELEKHLAELDKVRGEHNGGGASFSGIPASALMPPRSMHAMTEEDNPPPKVAAKIELQRILGAGGNHTAVVTMNGQEKTVHIGDQLSDGSLVTDITSRGVALRHDGTTHQLEIKDIDVIYGRTY